MPNIFAQLTNILAQDDRFVSQDGVLLKNSIQECIWKNDPALITLLLSDSNIKKHLFYEVAGVLIFDKEKCIRVISNTQFLPSSYTAFKNKIGLTSGGEYLSKSKEVVLAWPYKDCVLEGGMTKEEHARNEIFYNETLAPDDITRLLDPKAFTDFKRIDKAGQHALDGFTRNEQGTITDNLIIKGNNLLALASLQQEFAGKVKLIYIDPPYNTGNDGFKYNDSFNHSSWLTFMKNRLEIASTLLADSGLIWISINDNEGHYLKVICDEVFGRNNFVADVIWNSTKSVTNTAIISDSHTHNLLYAHNIEWLKNNRIDFRLPGDELRFSNADNDPRGKWVADPFQVGGIRPNQQYEIKNPNTGEIYTPLAGNSWKNEKKVFDMLIKDKRIVFGASGKAGPQRKRFWNEAKERGKVTTTLWNDIPTTTHATRHLQDMFKEKVFNNPKPEGLLQRIIHLSTQPGDIVLDFFAGSGTTACTALKMGRQFVAIEQMLYANNILVERLKKVIAGEQGGISKSVHWQGGGNFVYMELAQWNEIWKNKITAARSGTELTALWYELKTAAFLSYKVDPATIDANVDAFAALSLEDQKRFLNECIDKNHLYINMSEIADTTYHMSADDQRLNHNFYNSR